MEQYINLEETPFKDLRSKSVSQKKSMMSSQFQQNNLPQGEDKIEYKIHKNFIKIDFKVFEVASNDDQMIID